LGKSPARKAEVEEGKVFVSVTNPFDLAANKEKIDSSIKRKKI